MKLADPVRSLPGIGERGAKLFKKVGVSNLKSLLFLLPHRLEDHSNVKKISSLSPNEESVISGVIDKVHSRRTKRGGLLIEARITDDSGSIAAIWFNQRFLLSQLKPGQPITLFGSKKIAPSIGNPFVVKRIINTAGFLPIYPLTKGLYQGHITRAVRLSLPLCEKIKDVLPELARKRFQLPTRAEALKMAHQPSSNNDLQESRRLLAVEELLGLALSVKLDKLEQVKNAGEKLIADTAYLKKFVSSLPFALTNSQRQAAWQIIQRMSNGYPAKCLLYGEVGSGKTIVSLLAALAIIRSGRKVVILVPTTALATQQVAKIRELLKDQATVSLVTGLKKEALEADIIVGTHALLNAAERIKNIGLIIIDEQQRFGVEQRQKLLKHHGQSHLLMTTATPIPRSLSQTIFGNLEIIYLLDKPQHQQPVTTKRFRPNQRQSVINEVRRRLASGDQGFVICPAINETAPVVAGIFEIPSEKSSVTKELKRISQELPGARIAALHGQLKAEQKETVLKDFLNHKIDVLVATTVVEVGIDNPNASWIIIENAEMYGLSALHQLRGRVGRGSKQSICFLSQSSIDPIAQKRLAILEESADGLALSEMDLSLRGPGEVLGLEQSGLPSLRFADLSDKKLIAEVFALAEEIVKDGVDKYPSLKRIITKVDGLAAS